MTLGISGDHYMNVTRNLLQRTYNFTGQISPEMEAWNANFGKKNNADSVEISDDYLAQHPVDNPWEYLRGDEHFVANQAGDYYGFVSHSLNKETNTYDRYFNGKLVKQGVDRVNARGYEGYMQDRMPFLGHERYFFFASTDFLMDAANEYAKIASDQEYIYRPTQDDEFVRSTLDWFSGNNATQEDYDAMKNSVDKIVKELAERVRKGESTDLSTLENKIDVFGEQVSVAQIKEIQKTSRDLIDAFGSMSFGTGYIGQIASKGLVGAAANVYGNSLGGRLGEMYKSAFATEVRADLDGRERGYQAMLQSSAEVGMNPGTQIYLDYSEGRNMAEGFAGMDAGSKAELIEMFSKQSAMIDHTLQSYNQKLMGLANIDDYKQDITSQFEKLLSIIK